MLDKFLDKKTLAIMTTLHNVFAELDIDAYLIGAQARDVWFLPIKVPRITHDIDWVVAHSSEIVFNELKRVLIEREGFTQMRNPLKLKSRDGIEVDLIPFDHAEIPHFIGLQEIFQRGTADIEFDNNKIYKIATLPSIVLLKLVAWHNRPSYWTKDIIDIAYIIKHYDIYSYDVMDNHYDLYNELEPEYISPRVIGRHIGFITANSTDLKKQLMDIIETQIKLSFDSKLVQTLMNETDETESVVLKLLSEMLIGIQET